MMTLRILIRKNLKRREKKVQTMSLFICLTQNYIWITIITNNREVKWIMLKLKEGVLEISSQLSLNLEEYSLFHTKIKWVKINHQKMTSDLIIRSNLTNQKPFMVITFHFSAQKDLTDTLDSPFSSKETRLQLIISM